MGCAQSRIDNEESVSRCKDRKNLMKDAVIARNAFAAGHSGYAVALKNTGAALSDYGHGEVLTESEDHNQEPSMDPRPRTPPPPPPPPPPPHMDQLPPPPPLPNFSPSPIKPITRTMSMPEIPLDRKPTRQIDSMVILEEDEEEEEEEEEQHEQVNVGNVNEKKKNVDSKVAPQNTPDHSNNNVRPPPPPPMSDSKNMAWDYFFMVENMAGSSLDAENNGNENEENNAVEFGQIGKNNTNIKNNNVDDVEPKTPEKAEQEVEVEVEVEEGLKEGKQVEHSNTGPVEFRRVAETVVSGVNLMKVLSAIDDHFLKASESAQEVSKMLEATRLHYHSNFADNRGDWIAGHIDHSARVMRVITWNRSFRGVNNGEGGKDELDSDEYETHATVLDKLLAWEKKLYDEVKQGELMKLEYKRKVALLNKQKKRSAGVESLEKTKAAVSHLHTRYIVDMQSMDSTVSEVNRIRDEQLYPKLVVLVDGMAKMWGSMCIHHDDQLKIVTDLKSLDIAQAPKETTKHHHERTIQLWNVVQEWHSQFEKLVTHQKQYIQYLNSWLKLNLIPIESSLKEKIASPPRVQNPPIQALLHSWHDYLDKLPDELAKSATASFAAVIKTIVLHQEEEMKLKEKCEETRKEFLRRNQSFEEWYQKYMQRRTPPDEMDAERGEDVNPKNPVSERQFVVDSLKKRLEEELEAHQRHCLQVREKSLGTLKMRLPELFRAMSDYAHACFDAYEKLRLITESQKSNGGPP